MDKFISSLAKVFESFKELHPLAFVMGIIFIMIVWVLFFSKDENSMDGTKESIITLKDEIKNNSRLLLKILNQLQNNKNGLMISVNAIILEEQTDLINDLNDIIDHNHFKENIEHLTTKLDHAVDKFKTDLHSKIFQTTSDRHLVEIVDKSININEAIKEIFIKEIEKEKTDYEFLKTKIDSYMKKIKTELIKAVYDYYEDNK